MNDFTMFENIKKAFVPHFIGLIFVLMGWYISILNVGLDRFQPNTLFTKWTFFGLVLILLGTYIPQIWLGFSKKFSKK